MSSLESRMLGKAELKVDLSYGFTARELSDPEVGEKGLFEWQKPHRLGDYGGLEGLAAGLRSNLITGLTNSEAAGGFADRTAHFGSNKKVARSRVTFFDLIWEGLHDFTLIILIIAAFVSIILGVTLEDPSTGWIEGAAILVAVVLVLNVAAVNDLQKDKQFRELQAMNDAKYNKIIRDGVQEQVLVDDIQVGDLMYLEYGDQVPADAIFIKGSNVRVDEAAMTGESDLAKKNPDRPFMISGTALSEGFCTALVVSVGSNSVQGKAMALLSDDGDDTPLQKKLERLATQISKLGFVVGLGCVVVMVARHVYDYLNNDGTVGSDGEAEWTSDNYSQLLEYFIVGITVLVVAIPEGLPLAVTIALAYSVKKMMKDSNLVRHLDACETMGGATTICSDKTGTLTQNKMKVMQAYTYTGPREAVFLSKNATGKTDEYNEFMVKLRATTPSLTEALVDNCVLNSTASFDVTSQTWLGSKTEIALLLLAKEQGGSREASAAACAGVRAFPFTSARKRSSVVVCRRGTVPADQKYRVYVKGASETVLRLCTHALNSNTGAVEELSGEFNFDEEGGVTGSGAKAFVARDVINTMATQALRTIALGYRDIDGPADLEKLVTYSSTDNKGEGECPAVEDGLTLLGVVGIQDPVRPEVPDSVKACQRAGIVVRMVTGDNIATAKAIAKQCNIYHEGTWADAFGVARPAGSAVEGEKFRNMVGGLVLPPHFDHVCNCRDLSHDRAHRAGYTTAPFPEHYGYPSIVGERTTECMAWEADAVASRGTQQSKVKGRGLVAKCTPECKQRGCREQMEEGDEHDDKFKIVKHQAVFDDLWPSLEVMARSTPSDKHLLVSGLIERGQVVAVTGDGTNDGPALKKADVGFAMGIAGTEVAKEASDIILMDDNFTSIVAAVSWGRNVYDSIRKFLVFQLTVNVVALFIAALGAVVLRESPLKAVQLLWVNLIMDTFASLALATEPPTPELLDRMPYGRSESLVSQVMLRNIIGHSVFQAIVLCLVIFDGAHIFDVPVGTELGHEARPTQHYTMVFHVFVMMQVFNEVNARKIHNEANVFGGILDNHVFGAILVFTIVVQYVLVGVGGLALSVESLTTEQHVAALVIGLWSLVMGQAVRLVDPDLFLMMGSKESTEADKRLALFTRRNTRPSAVKMKTSSKRSVSGTY